QIQLAYCVKEIKPQISCETCGQIITGPKKCGLLIFPGRLPQAPSGRQSAAPLLLLFNCVTSATPFPQKSQTLALITVRGCLPQSLHSPQFLEPDPIYPYLPFLFCSSLWQRPCHQSLRTNQESRCPFLLGFRKVVKWKGLYGR